MPEGIYRREYGKVHRGDIVAFCLEELYKSIGLKRFYIEKSRICQGSDPLIKQVIAIAEDKIVLTDQSIAVNEKIYPYRTLYKDSNWQKLAVYPRGIYYSHGYWVIGTHSLHSWDSRYFGEISQHQLLSL